MLNGQGHLVPVTAIREIDLLRDDLVSQMIQAAKLNSGMIANFKANC